MAQAAAAAKAAGSGSSGRRAAPAAGPGGRGAFGPRTDPSSKNAKEFVSSLVSHEYLNRFKLPDMPP